MEQKETKKNGFLKGDRYFEIYQKIYQFHQKYADASSDDEWDTVINELSAISDLFERDLCIAIVNEIERAYEKRDDHGNTKAQ